VAQPEFDQHVHDIMDNKGSGMYVWRNYRLRTLFRAWLHVWAADGSHMGWRDIPDWLQTVKAMLGHTVSRAAAYRYLQRERGLYRASEDEDGA
jgi:hypothetical protein